MDFPTPSVAASATAGADDVASAAASVSPMARRYQRPGWRDPRLWMGLILIAGSVLIGARVLAGADDTTAVWVVRDDAGLGARLERDDLAIAQVRFTGPDLERYLPVADGMPTGVHVVRPVGAGELLPRAALGEIADSATDEVPLAVAVDQVPAGLAAGATVDVYVLDGGQRGPALSGVTVLDPGTDDAYGGDQRRVVVAVAHQDTADFLARVGRNDQPRLVLATVN